MRARMCMRPLGAAIVPPCGTISLEQNTPLQGVFCFLSTARSLPCGLSAFILRVLLANEILCMQETAEYKVLEDIEIEGVSHSAGAIITLNSDVAESLVQDGKIEASGAGEGDGE